MFSSSPFGQSSSTPFGSQPAFGQSNVTNNPFAPNPFGATSPFGAQTGGSMFGSTSTGVFGQPSAPAFGAASSPAFGSSTPAFGSSTPAFGSSTPAFGSSSSPFGGSSAFGQKSFGGFGTGTQTSPFGSTPQQSQPAFGNNLFGSAPFGASSQSTFGGTSTPAFQSSPTGFGASSSPAFGVASSPAFGSTPFGAASTGAFGSPSTSVFAASSGPTFGSTTTPPFGATSTSAFGTASTSAFGVSSSSAFGASGSTPPFGGASTPSFNLSSGSVFGQSTPTLNSSPFGTTSSPFGQGSLGAQTTTSTFGSGGFGQPNAVGSRVTPYQATADTDGNGTQAGKLESISAMAAYKDKSHEELRWEDYQRGDKGGPNPAGQSNSGIGFSTPGTAPSPFGSTPTFGQPPSNSFSQPSQSNIFAARPSPFGSTGPGTSSPSFGSSAFPPISATTPTFGSSATPTSSPFGTTAFNSSSSLFGGSNSPAIGSSNLFSSTPSQGQMPFGSTSAFGSQPSSLFQSTPSLGLGSTPGQNSSTFGASSLGTGSFLGGNTFNIPSSGNPFSNSSFATSSQFGFNQSTPSLTTPFQQGAASLPGNPFNFNNPGQTQGGGGASIFGQTLGQPSANHSFAAQPPVAVTNPFGTLPAMPQMLVGNNGSSPSIQYGISSMPVVDKPTPARVSSLLTSRHLSQRRIRLPARKYHPKNDGSRVAFFSDEDEAPSNPKADALFIPRENPRALIIRPIDQWPKSATKEACAIVHENDKPSKEKEPHLNGSITEGNNRIANGNGYMKEQSHPFKTSQKANGSSDDTPNQKGDSYITLSGHRAGEAAIVYEHGADIEAMMPKLRHSDYYTEPRIQELAAKERAEPGFCRHVKNFVVGRHNYGSIKFLGETDVRRLDLESIIQFNNREVIVYSDDSKKPPVGQGLNKPAEVTLLNIKCHDKKTGKQIVEGLKLEKYKEMLKKKAEEQGAEFLSYDPAKAEWRFKVDHFSTYFLSDDDLWDTD